MGCVWMQIYFPTPPTPPAAELELCAWSALGAPPSSPPVVKVLMSTAVAVASFAVIATAVVVWSAAGAGVGAPSAGRA